MKPKPSVKNSPLKARAERVVKDIRRATRRHFSAEDNIRIVLDGLRGDPMPPEKLVCPMVERFMATDREFAKLRRRS